MNKVKINNVEMPLRFKYKYNKEKRLSIEKTINSVIVQTQPYVIQDTTIEWEYPFASLSDYSLISNLYLNNIPFQFVDYDNNIYEVMIIKFEEEEVSGYYNLKGNFLILQT